MVIVPTNFSAVFLDRDGIINKPIIINKKPYAPKKYSEFKFYPGIYENLQALKNNGFLIIVVTNQPDIGNGITKLKEVQLMHDKLMKTNLIDKICILIHIS